MHLLHVGGIALNQTPLDWNGNRDRIVAGLDAARSRGLAVVCLPELCITGYGCEDAFQSPGVQRTAWEVLQEILHATRGLVVAVGLPVRFESGLYDCAAMLVDGRIAGIVAKQHLAGDGIHYEPRWFRPWPAGRRQTLSLGGTTVPFGDLRFDVGGVRFGFEICEDAWVAGRPGAVLAARGVDVLLNPSASHFAFSKDEVRRRFVLEGSRAFGVTYVYANLVGNEAGRAIYDGGVMIATAGRMAAVGRRFCFGDFSITSSIVDLDATRLAQSRMTGLVTAAEADRDAAIASSTESECVAVGFRIPQAELIAPKTVANGREENGRDAWESGGHVKEEEFTRAVALGLFDYLRKSRSRGFVVSASGGADSSAVACLVALAMRLASAEMGAAAAANRVGMPLSAGDDDGGEKVRALVRSVLTCVYQSTVNSGDITRSAARDLSEAIGAEFHEFEVEPIVQAYQRLVSGAIGRPLEWSRDDVALQNIQARARSPGVWMLANVRGALLVSTSNRSEAAVGYATMDGDTSGGIAPVAGIDKNYLRKWLVWLEREGPEGIGPIPALGVVNAQQPTAELRPPSAHQTDEADLMPYDVLDAIERSAIRDKQTPLEAWRQLAIHFPRHAPTQLAAWTERFFTLWCRNQWKRERYAPSFHLDDENLDPRSWCRFPILSGGYERELADLRRVAEASASGKGRPNIG